MVRVTEKPEKVGAELPASTWFFLAISIMILAASAYILLSLPKFSGYKEFEMEPIYRLFLMLIPILVLTFLFSYLPLLGWRYAFFDYKAGVLQSCKQECDRGP